MPTVTTQDMEELETRASDPPWDYLNGVDRALAEGSFSVGTFRAALLDGDTRLRQRFIEDEPIEWLVRDRARLVDLLLRSAWKMHIGPHAGEIALLAVGGYGRGELTPCSDIDVMVLLPKSEHAPWQPQLEGFLTFMWDIGLEVGHSVRTIDDCQRESAADVSVATTLIEARLLAGPELLVEAMRRALAPELVWPTKDFFEAKVAEQTARHRLQP
jgi:[protein-PII] uridylyltransferase